ncbi:unnamed protein product [Tilletia laevis]|uniref:Uncharacterized protein n=2 Tax=Tilletia TaxID=13289 RepID=A0A177UZS7_9BASI|nr:hypothetical protein CF336_g661 [Tilletia laevis]KAE8256799.1 hypothetical protein A4X03_0g5043 [Tilletia caries]KAE8208421.1 hypothetical protein CF335_g420 [Tilletia laevis]CAD6892452.1 unnamed protein product [Tilletia caries]CAD6932307.1 unnamed protein product [Tilletia caries]
MFTDVYGSSTILADLRRLSTVSTSSESSSVSAASSSQSTASFAAGSRLEEAADEEDAAMVSARRRQRSLSSLGLEKCLSIYGPAPRLATSPPRDQEAQANPSTGEDAKKTNAAGSASMSTAGAFLAGPTMQYLLSGGNPASLIPSTARRTFRFRRVTSRSRNASSNYTPMSAGGPLSLTRLFAALVLLCTVGVLVAPIPASAIRPHTRSYTVHRPAGTHSSLLSNRDQIIEAGHLIPPHYSAGVFNSRAGGGHAQLFAQRRAERQEHASFLAQLEEANRGPKAVNFDADHPEETQPATARTNEHRQRTGQDLLAITRGMAAINAEATSAQSAATIKRLSQAGHDRHRYHHLHANLNKLDAEIINSADLSPFAHPPPSLAAADLFDPQSVFSQPAAAGAAPSQVLQQHSKLFGAAAMPEFIELGIDSVATFDSGFAGLRGHSFRSHLRSLS